VESLVKILLDNGADVNAKGQENQHPLQWASRRRHDGVAQILIDNGADTTVSRPPLKVAKASKIPRLS